MKGVAIPPSWSKHSAPAPHAWADMCLGRLAYSSSLLCSRRGRWARQTDRDKSTGEVPYLGTGSYHSLKRSKVQDKHGGPSVVDLTPAVLQRFGSVAKTPTVKSQAQVKKLLPNSLTSEASVASRPGSGPRETTLLKVRKRAQKMRLVRYYSPTIEEP